MKKFTTNKNKLDVKTLTTFLVINFWIMLGILYSSEQSSAGNTDLQMLYNDSEVAIINITIDPEDLEMIFDNPHSDVEYIADFHFQNAVINNSMDSVGFRLRGNTSRNSQKKSFKISFNTFKPGRKFFGVEKLNINGEHNDPSIIRSKICWDIYEKMGVTASSASHAALYINNEYYGLYISIEHIDEEFLDKHYINDSGNLWKCLWPADLVYKGADPNLYKEENGDRRTYDLKTNRDEDDYSKLAKLIDIINNTSDEEFYDSLSSVINIPGVLKYFAVNVLIGSWDDYWFLKNNYYLYHDPDTDLFNLIPYDYDNCLGIDWFEVDWTSINPYEFEIINGEYGSRPLAERIMHCPELRNLYTHFLEFIKENIINLANLEPEIDQIKTMITPFAEADTYRTLDYGFSVDDFHDSYSISGYQNQHVKTGIKEFILRKNLSLPSKLEYLDARPILYYADHFPKHPVQGDSVEILISAFSPGNFDSLYVKYWTDESEMEIVFFEKKNYANTLKVEENDRYSCKIPIPSTAETLLYYVYIKDENHEAVKFPHDNPRIVIPSKINSQRIVINELLAKNDNNIVDENGENDDWIELFNPTNAQIILDNYYLSDNPENLTKWKFPQKNVKIEPGEYILIWADEDQEQGDLHTNFKLSASGEFLALIHPDGFSVLDSITFGLQSSDISFGRKNENFDSWVYFENPTPLSKNIYLDIQNEVEIPNKFDLTNFPNPFNPITQICFALNIESNIKLSIYNLGGEEIRVLINKKLESGKHYIDWDGRNNESLAVSSGIYFCLLETQNQILHHKMVLIR